MPNRILKECINESRSLSECTIFAQDLYKRLIVYADDYGRFSADTQIMRARLYPRELDIIAEDDIEEALIELAGVSKIDFYTSKGRKEVYGCFPNWKEHQRIRDSKSKCPEPDDTEINNWYLLRFVPLAMKADIIVRDAYKCKLCGKFLTSCLDAKKFVKLCRGTYHIEHIVPCTQGGRATMENLRLLCPSCYANRKRKISMDDIIAESAFSSNDSQIAADCGELPQVAAGCGLNPIQSNPNPIQSESNPNLNPRVTPAGVVVLDCDFSDGLKKSVEDWLEYKRQKNEKYKPKGLEAFLNKVKLHSKQYGENAVIEGINEAMANGWKGIVWDKIKKAEEPVMNQKNKFHNFEQKLNNTEGGLEALSQRKFERKLNELGIKVLDGGEDE